MLNPEEVRHWSGVGPDLAQKEALAVFRSIEKYTMQKKFPVTSNLRYIYGVLNMDKIKN
jgi:hypothetical protein